MFSGETKTHYTLRCIPPKLDRNCIYWQIPCQN